METLPKNSKRSSAFRSWTILSAFLVLPFLCTGCGKKVQAKTEVVIRQVETISPTAKTIVRPIEQPGYLKSYEETPIFSKLAGYAKNVNVDKGFRVKKDDVLAKLYVPEMDQDLLVKKAKIKQADADLKQSREAENAAKALMDAAKARIKEAEASVLRSQADVDRWQLEYDRGTKLSVQGVYDKQTLEETFSQLRSTQAVHDEMTAKLITTQAVYIQATAQYHKSQADVASAEAHVEVAKAEYDQWKAWLDYANITAPYDGMVTFRNVNTGDFCNPGASSTSGAMPHQLFTMMRTDIMRLIIDVPEKDAVLVKEGDPVTIRFAALPGKEFTDKLTLFSWSLDNHSRTLSAEIHMKNSKQPDGQDLLRPGMYANVTILATVPNVMQIPPEAILTDGDISYCFRVEDGKVRKTILKLGVQTAKSVEIYKKLSEAPKPGEPIKWEPIVGNEVIVTSNPGSLVDGQTVEIKKSSN